MAKRKTPAVRLKAEEVNQTAKWVLTGASAADVAEAIRAANFEGEPGALMMAAMEQFRAAGNFDPDIVRGFVFEGIRDLYRKCNESGDYATALRALKELERMARNVRDQQEGDPQAEDEEADAGAEVAGAIAGPT